MGLSGPRRYDVEEGDFIAKKFLSGEMFEGLDVEPVFEFGHHGANGLHASLEQIASAASARCRGSSTSRQIWSIAVTAGSDITAPWRLASLFLFVAELRRLIQPPLP